MIDLETLATSPDAKILSISAVLFDPFDPEPDPAEYPALDLLIDLEGQDNRREDPDTLAWWAKQDSKVIDHIFSEDGRVPLNDALVQLSKFVWNKSRLWSQGSFDFEILTHALHERRMSIPWPYYVIRDSRTLCDLVDVPIGPTSHDSLQDCLDQILKVQATLATLGVTKFVRS